LDDPSKRTAFNSSVHASLTFVLALTIGLAGCTSTEPSPSGGGGNAGGGGGNGPTITITANGVAPSTVTVSRGMQVTFVNNDSRAHEMASDPHPTHTNCPELNAVGFLNPGASRQTSNLDTVGTCGFHDHNQPQNAGLHGNIVIQ
jgi:plastocyanin